MKWATLRVQENRVKWSPRHVLSVLAAIGSGYRERSTKLYLTVGMSPQQGRQVLSSNQMRTSG